MQKYDGQLLRKFEIPLEGIAYANVTITVRNYSNNNISLLYSDINGTIPKSNPFVSDSNGYYSFYAPDGKYLINFANGAPTLEITMLDTYNPTEQIVGSLFAKAIVDLNFVANEHKIYGPFGLERTALTAAITTTRNSTATYQTPTGIATAAINTPRITFDAATGNALGLLAEEQRTNLLLHSEALDNAVWTKTNTTVTANNTVAPDGATTADKVVENTANSTHLIRQTSTFAASTAYTFSAYLKAGERSAVTMLVLDNASNIASWHVNLLTGVITQGATSLASTAVIVSVGRGWHRVSISFTTTAAPVGYVDFRLSNVWPVLSSTGAVYAGDGTSGLFVWGAQLEAGTAPTSHMPTATAAMVRFADVIGRSLPVTNANAGAIFIEFDMLSAIPSGLFTAVVKITDAANTGNRGFALRLSANTFAAVIRGDTDSASAGVIVSDAATPKKALMSFDNNEKKLLIAIDGIVNEITIAAAVNMSAYASHIFVAGATGISGTSTTHSKTVKRCTYFPRSFTAAEAQAITL